MGSSTAIRGSDWKDGFLFLGNHPALDFLNTRPVQDGKAMELLPDFTALLRWFQAADLLSSRDAAKLQQQWGQSLRGQRLVEGVRVLREKLRKEVLGWERGGAVHRATVDELNRLMAVHPMHVRLKTSGEGYEAEQYLAAEEPEDLFAPIVHSAATLFADVDRKRVRKCDECVLHFHDISKKGTRRWCSMQFCGNRQKVAAYAARRRFQRR
jgi:predicted RNA-binding Zn ribbon-like protein